MGGLKPCPLSSERAIEILWGEVAQDQQPLHCTRKELCDSVEMAEESIRHSYPKSDNAELYQKAYQELLQKSMHLNQELIKKLKAAQENEPLTLEQFEAVCESVHNGWWEECKRQGRTNHPDMKPYDELPESVKDYDRVTVQRVLDTLGIKYMEMEDL